MSRANPRQGGLLRIVTVSAWVWAVWMAGALAVSAPARAACVGLEEFCDLPVESQIEQPDFARAIDVVLVGDGFTTASSWSTAAQSMISTFQAQAATGIYGSLPNAYNFHVVTVLSATSDVGDTDTQDTALGMVSTGNKIITANGYRVSLAAANAPDADVVVAIANTSGGRANATFPNGFLSGGTIRISKSAGPVSHEMGHALFHLADEYEESSLCGSPTETSLVDQANVTTQAGCAKFEHVPGAACVQGGSYCSSGVYRPASGCLMRASGNQAMCPVCRHVRDGMLQRLRTERDSLRPWAAFSQPAAGAQVAGLVRLNATAYDHRMGPMRVAVTVDGALLGVSEGVTHATQFTWDSRGAPDGPHEVALWIDDMAGNSMEGHRIALWTSRWSDLSAPFPVILTPSVGQVVNGDLYLYAQAKESSSSNASATDVKAMWATIDGVVAVASASGTTLSGAVSAAATGAGPHSVQVFAMDWAGNIGASEIRLFEFAATPTGGEGNPNQPGGQNGGPEGGGYYLYLESPPSWSVVAPQFALTYQLSGGEGGGSAGLQGGSVDPSQWTLQLWKGGSLLQTVPTPTSTQGQPALGSAIIDASGWALGPHELRLTAKSVTGEVVEAALVVVREPDADTPAHASILTPNAFSGVASGDVEVSVHAWHPDGVELVDFYFDGAWACTVSGSAGTCTWHTNGADNGIDSGCGQLRAIAYAADGTAFAGGAGNVCIDNVAPTVEVLFPSGQVGVGTQPVALVPNGTGSSIREAALWVDGVAASQAGQTYANPLALWGTWEAGEHVLRARVVDSVGLVGEVEWTVIATDCSAEGCAAVSACEDHRCAPDGSCVRVPVTGCCEGDEECDDGDSCTADHCEPGGCVHDALPGCCHFGATCDDGQPCTINTCSGVGGECEINDAGCCMADEDCLTCAGASAAPHMCLGAEPAFCEYGSAPASALACCQSDAQCVDANPCTMDACVDGACVHPAKPDCCDAAAQCNDADPCTLDLCVNSECQHVPLPGCCHADADCASLNPCGTTKCAVSAGICQTSQAKDCCAFDADCKDYNACTSDRCVGGQCEFVNQCCVLDSDCDENEGEGEADICTSHACVAGFCQATAVPGCCPEGEQCSLCPADYGDVNGESGVTVSDVACVILANLWVLSGTTTAAPPECVGGQWNRADLDCDETISVGDVVLAITLALGLPLESEIDTDADGCADACAAMLPL